MTGRGEKAGATAGEGRRWRHEGWSVEQRGSLAALRRSLSFEEVKVMRQALDFRSSFVK